MRRGLERWATTVLAATVGFVACACAGGGSGPADATPTPEPTEQPTPAGTPTATPAPFVSIPEITPTHVPCGICGNPVKGITPTATPDPRQPTPAPTRSGGGESAEVSLPPQLTLDLDPSLTEQEVAYFKRAVSDAIRQASADFGVQSPTFTLFAYRDQDVIIAKRAAWRGERPDQSSNTFPCNLCAETDAGVVLLRLGPGWFDDTVFPRRQVGRATVTHEIYHIFQIDALRGKNYDPARGPAWLLEGSAQWLAYRVMSAQLGPAWDTVLSTERERMRSDSSSLQSLEDLGVFARGAAPYSLGLTAVDLLVEGRTLGDIAMFYRQLGQGEPWQAAFASAFGTIPGEFYEKFATFRAAH